MIEYNFVTDWVFKASADKVWALIEEPETTMSWWPEIKEFKIKGENKYIAKGNKIDVVIRGIPIQFRFSIEVTQVDPKKELRVQSTGDLEGYGVLTLKEEADSTKMKYVWEIRTTKWWANVIGFIFKPLLIWSHNRAMRSGCEALANRLEVPR